MKTYDLITEGDLTRLRLSDKTEALFMSRHDADEEGKRLIDPTVRICRVSIPVKDRIRQAKEREAAMVPEGTEE